MGQLFFAIFPYGSRSFASGSLFSYPFANFYSHSSSFSQVILMLCCHVTEIVSTSRLGGSLNLCQSLVCEGLILPQVLISLGQSAKRRNLLNGPFLTWDRHLSLNLLSVIIYLFL